MIYKNQRIQKRRKLVKSTLDEYVLRDKHSRNSWILKQTRRMSLVEQELLLEHLILPPVVSGVTCCSIFTFLHKHY
jgi:hypothetical protein